MPFASLKKVQKVNCRLHKERQQPASRSQYGILPKKQDVKPRQSDTRVKKDLLRFLKKKSYTTNENEFYFGMINSRLENGIHEELPNSERRKYDPTIIERERMNILTTSRNSLRNRLVAERNKLEKLKAEMPFGDISFKNRKLTSYTDASTSMTTVSDSTCPSSKYLSENYDNVCERMAIYDEIIGSLSFIRAIEKRLFELDCTYTLKMHIKNLVLDGFKSYAHKTEINGFDPVFNAITGLNGSGKSNILDSLCFLFGITNLSQVRATSLQDLVYKSGQAGITKATVSIVFDNTNKALSPYGYEQFDELTVTRQIVVGGRNRYLINGTNANNTRVADLFRSIQLNVNNPHFLIMQGRVTKVLNMKPEEILSLLEEAAGTKLYEHKKETALNTIEKKDHKLREIEQLLADDINPTINKLRQERSLFLEYQNVCRKLEHLEKYVTAHEYFCLETVLKKSADDVVELTRQIESGKSNLCQLQEALMCTKKELEDAVVWKEELCGQKFDELDNSVSSWRKEVAKKEANACSKKDAVSLEKRGHKQLVGERRDTEILKQTKEDEFERNRESFELIEQRSQSAKEELEKAERHYENIQSGLTESAEDGGPASTLEEQYRTAQAEVVGTKSTQQQAEMQLKHLKCELERKQSSLKRMGAPADAVQTEKAVKNLNNEILKLQSAMEKLNITSQSVETVQSDIYGKKRELLALREKSAMADSRYPQFNFVYDPPYNGFDSSTVKGTVANLFRVKDPKFYTALEVLAGGKLSNVIVDKKATGTALLQRGNLRRRITLLPLDKIRGQRISKSLFHTATNMVGAGNVWDPLDLIEYDKEVEPAMEFVFGGCLICSNADAASSITYDVRTRKMTVTLDGDSYNPSGSLTGGSLSRQGSVLREFHSTFQSRNHQESLQKDLQQLNDQLNAVTVNWEERCRLNTKLEEKQYELKMLQIRMQQSERNVLLCDIEALNEDIRCQTTRISEAQRNSEKYQRRVQDLEEKIANVQEYREAALQLALQKLDKARNERELSEAALHDRREGFEMLRLEIEELRKEIVTVDNNIALALTKISEAEASYELAQTELKDAKVELKVSADRLADQKRLLCEQEAIIASIRERLESENNELRKIEMTLKDTEYQLEMHAKERHTADHRLAALLKNHEWIDNEKHLFGENDGPFDFRTGAGSGVECDPKEAAKQLDGLRQHRDKLKRTVNMRAMNLLSQAEEQYATLINKRSTVLKDKMTIQNAIDDMDKKKNETLMTAYGRVNEDFGNIFTTLLAGTKAQLKPLLDHGSLMGIEFRIGFGDIWKESLSELSGGQRSLVALSLILALLRFKPAPLYILDEIDAALDLTHTQNIGTLIREKFQNSQFIIVSLKDGMFNNANVLFKTKFVDGVSTVTRHVNQVRRKA